MRNRRKYDVEGKLRLPKGFPVRCKPLDALSLQLNRVFTCSGEISILICTYTIGVSRQVHLFFAQVDSRSANPLFDGKTI